MTKKQEAQERKAFLDSFKQYNAAVTMWRNEDIEKRKFLIPSNVELTSFLLHRMRLAKLALRIAIRAVRRHNANYNEHTHEDVIRLWEKLSRL